MALVRMASCQNEEAFDLLCTVHMALSKDSVPSFDLLVCQSLWFLQLSCLLSISLTLPRDIQSSLNLEQDAVESK